MRKILLLILLLSVCYPAVIPDWTVNAADYEFSGSVTSIVIINDVEQADVNDWLGAFVGDECRGIASLENNSVLDYTVQLGHVFFTPTVYGNESATMTFTHWDFETNAYTEVGFLEYSPNMAEGDFDNPHIFCTGICECGGDGIDEGACDCDGNVEDCSGECGGDAVVDECGECGGDGIDEGACDCDGNVEDCSGECGGSAVVDECGECGGDGINEGACDCDGNVLDCAGICGGSAELDECDVCNGDNISCSDCCGVPNGDGSTCDGDDDDDGVCDGDEVDGCTNVSACNYDSTATDDDGLCQVPTPCDSCASGELVANGSLDGVCETCVSAAIVDNDTDDDEICNANDHCAETPTGETADENGCAISQLSITNLNLGMPTEFAITQNYPNPFNPMTKIAYDVPKMSYVSIKIYNLSGVEVAELIKGNTTPGSHIVTWNASDYTSGIYFVKMVAGDYINTQKLMLIK